MRIKTYQIIAVVLLGLTSVAYAVGNAPVGKFPKKIEFEVAKNSPKSCLKEHLPILQLTVDRNHPARKSLLILPKESPYTDAQILASDPYDSKAPVKHFTDQVTLKTTGAVMTLVGIASSNAQHGVWHDNKGCSGTFVVAQ
jgi:hypothetical protein